MDLADLAKDPIDLYEKCDRVRSWYMYEQLKSLERDQQDAARRLKSKSSMERCLRRGLSERRVNRRLSDQFPSCHSELLCSSSKSELVTTASCSLDNFFVDLCEQETYSFYNDCTDDKESRTYNDFTDSVIRDYDKANFKVTKKLIRQLEHESDDIEDVELCDGEISEQEGFTSSDLSLGATKNRLLPKYGINTGAVMSMWSKLVTYAHRLTKLNHGANCYMDYSSQLLTAVLVVDVLRMFVGKMCGILQPLVCPVSFNCDVVFPLSKKKKHRYAMGKYCLLKCAKRRKEAADVRHLYHYENWQKEQKLKPPGRVLEKSLCECVWLRGVIDRLLALSRLVDDMLLVTKYN